MAGDAEGRGGTQRAGVKKTGARRAGGKLKIVGKFKEAGGGTHESSKEKKITAANLTQGRAGGGSLRMLKGRERFRHRRSTRRFCDGDPLRTGCWKQDGEMQREGHGM